LEKITESMLIGLQGGASCGNWLLNWEVTATSEEEVAQDFINFFQNFETIFDIKNFKIYITGESYAGRYVPYISAAMIDKHNRTCFGLAGEQHWL